VIPFLDYLTHRLEIGGFTTEDALASFLPLARQVAAAHAAGKVAPLHGVEHLRVEGVRIYFEESLLAPAKAAAQRLREFEKPAPRAIEVVGQFRLDVEPDSGRDAATDLRIGARGEQLSAPIYLPGYVAWDQEIGHHDPLADVFVMGLILASLACGLNLNHPEQLEALVRGRARLFDLNAQLHPVLAKMIVRMTELDRHRRPQDMAAVANLLADYRDQGVDLDFDLTRAAEWKSADPPTRKATILTCLRRRLFDVSRRNRLLHFRATNQSVNLTWASVPLAFDVQAIRPEQILTADARLQKSIASGGPLVLNKYLRFEEALYLPGQLDSIRNEARRDQTEYGFAQLRLVLCFLRWTNLKTKPPERLDSPLVLLPVRLDKTKGVRDVYTLEPLAAQAEINPVARHYLNQLYAIDLPDVVDLETSSLDELFEFLKAKVQASEPGVTLEKVDKPRINVIHAQAQRRLDQYQRRARLSGRGVRTFLNLDYSYDRDNYHPLGLRLFQTRLIPTETNLRSIIDETPRPRSFMAAAAPSAGDVRQRQLYARVEEQTNPYVWEFDLCNVTLGNFHYRKMSLVRDYETLIARQEDHPGFDALFSVDPKPTDAAPIPVPPLDDSFPIVACDSAQSSAIALARTKRTFITQGPPGTGKSQTITNLIADYVARGQRVLFVCEKRAAIDVVFQRLRLAGLDTLCCLIHDSQEDKKAFIQDLKQTYESLLETPRGKQSPDDARNRLLQEMQAELKPLEHVHRFMQAAPPQAGVPFRQLLDRAVELRHKAPEVNPVDRERLPDFALWHEHRDRIGQLQAHLDVQGADTVLARHPLRSLHARFAAVERPLEAIRDDLTAVQQSFDEIDAILESLDVPAECRRQLIDIRRLGEYGESLAFLAQAELIDLLQPKSDRAKQFGKLRRDFDAKAEALARAQEKTQAWRAKLSPDETEAALNQAQALEGNVLRFFQPRWWRLRSILRRHYDFSVHQVRPSWTQVLKTLQAEHAARAQLDKVEANARRDFALETGFGDFNARMARAKEALGALTAPFQALHRNLLAAPQGGDALLKLASLQSIALRITERMSALIDAPDAFSWDELRDELALIDESLDEFPDFKPCLTELGALPPAVALAWRRCPWRGEQIEAAVARRSAEDLLRTDPIVAKFSAAVQERRAAKLEDAHARWRRANAEVIRDRVRQRFLEHVRLSSLPHAELTPEQKEWKPRYNRGRRELEHEFGKTMRYRSIRDLVGGDSGLVVADLKPVWLMSPLSVSDTLPLGENSFDVVIFDEASQVTLEEAVPAIHRAEQVLIVGDEKQLPPTNFFAARSADDETAGAEDAAADFDFNSDSLLNHAARKLPATMLRWHYRSRSESLIGFSNALFYQGRLLTVPEVQPTPVGLPPIAAPNAEAGDTNVARLTERPVSFHFVEKALYQSRRNEAEADYIARLVRGLLMGDAALSIGVIAFSEAQEIEQGLARLARDDDAFRAKLEAEWEREEDGQFTGLLVKNLENIQGDERDVILLSVCYGPGPTGKMLMNFGPINQTGGERRLNVAFSRAKKHMALITSIRGHQITNDYNDGARALKNYLRYAEAASAGDLAAAQRILWEINPQGDAAARSAGRSPVIDDVARCLRERGFEVELGVGQSDFRCDLALRAPGQTGYQLGILIDAAAYDRNHDPLERDVFRPSLLRAFGWRIARVLSRDWFENPNGVLRDIERTLKGDDPHAPEVERADPVPPSHDTSPPTTASAARRYLELTDGASKKFWEIRVDGNQHTVRFGRIGAGGQSRTKDFSDNDQARRDADRLQREKLAKG
jgi:predicted DNA-binding WGR domain protein